MGSVTDARMRKPKLKTNRFLSAIEAVFSIFLFACSSISITNEPQSALVATVSILPQKYFLERIGGERVEVNVMVGPGESPHSYEPKAKQMTALSRSAVYFKIGVEFEEAWMERIISSNPDMLVVDLSQNITKVLDFGDLYNGEEQHGLQEMDPHIWTSPAVGSIIAKSIYSTLAEIDTQHKDDYHDNLDDLLRDIEQLQEDIIASLIGIKTGKFMVFHPGWSYFAREFGLEQIPIEIGGSEPSASELAHLIDTAKKENIRVIFAQPEFSTQSAEYIASEIGGHVILISPLAENWLENLRQIAITFSEVL